MPAVGVCALSFVLGAIPFSNITARWRRGVDLRHTGTGTVSGTSLYHVAGFPALAGAGILDVAKGAVGPLLLLDHPVAAGIAGGLAVAGHDWSPFLRGQGGRGLAPAIGSLLVNAWIGAVFLLVVLVAARLMHQTGLGGFAVGVGLTPFLAITNGAAGAVAGGAIAVPMLLKRVVGNAPPEQPGVGAYTHRLLFDRDPVPS